MYRFFLLNLKGNRPVCSGWTYRSEMNTSLKYDLVQVQTSNLKMLNKNWSLLIVGEKETRKLQEK